MKDEVQIDLSNLFKKDSTILIYPEEVFGKIVEENSANNTVKIKSEIFTGWANKKDLYESLVKE